LNRTFESFRVVEISPVRVVEIVPPRLIEVVPFEVVEIVPVLVVEIVPVLVVEIVPPFEKTGTAMARTNMPDKKMGFTFFIVLLLVR
jgi:hypothetical protein